MFPSRQEIINNLQELQDPEKILDAYYETYKNLPKQGSDEWLKTRKIGGSSIAPILGIEKFTTKKKIAENLLVSFSQPLSSFSPCEKGSNKKEGSNEESGDEKKVPKNEIAMNWGTVFEEAAKLYLSRFIKIYEFGSLPGFQLEDGTEVTSYSPDGLFIITPKLLDFFVYENPEALTGKPCLLEIKCPFMRKITGEVPEYYLPQIQLGMHTVNFVEHAFYSEFAFRICSLSDLNFSSSCSSFTNNSIYDTPKAIGFFGFTIEDDEFKTKIIPNSIHENLFPISSFSQPLSSFSQPLLQSNKEEKESIYKVGDALRDIESIYKNISEIEKFAYLQKIFNNNLVSEIFRVNYPKYDGIDFGGSLNFLYETTEISNEELIDFAKKKVRDGNYFASEQFSSFSGISEEINTWKCREFFANEIKKLESFAAGKKTGIICYKLFQVETNYIEKKPFESELNTILDFAQKIEDAKKKSPEEQKKLLELI